MKASRKERFLSYVIDLLLIGIILFVFNFFFENPKISEYNLTLSQTFEKFINHNIDADLYLETYAKTIHNIDKLNISLNVVNLILIVIFFIVIPYFNKNQTIGQKIMKVKITKENNKKVTIIDLFLRAIVLTGIINLLVMLSTIFLQSSNLYLIISIFFGFIQFLLVIISGFMVLYKEDQLGFQDLISKTKIIKEVKK